MSRKSNKKTWKNLGVAFMSVVVVLFLLGVILYKAGSPMAHQWAYRLGLANQSAILLTDTSWVWERTALPSGSVIEAPGGNLFVLSFEKDGRFTSTTDCNGLFGNFSAAGQALGMSSIISTDVACGPATLESEYSAELSRASTFSISGKRLTIGLSNDTGVMTFVRK